jgi:predicted flap endonuclease-1-like 5' DNA nuclease
MRAFLFTLLAAVAAIMLWAIRSESYQNGLVFALATLAAGLCGYLLADYFFNIEKKTLKEDVISAGKDIQALKDEKDLLQTQFNLATPHAQVEQLEQQLSFADEQRHKLDGLTRAQYAEIAALKTQLEMQKKNYQKLYEEAAIASETHEAEITNLQDTLASKREKIKYLTEEGEYLRNKIKDFETASDEVTIKKLVSETTEPPASNRATMVVKMPQNGNGSERGVLQMLDPRSMKSDTVEAEAVVETSTIEPQPIMELKPIEIKQVVEKKTADLSVVAETESNSENSAVEVTEIADAPPSVSEKKLSLAEIIAEVQAAELQSNGEVKVNWTETAVANKSVEIEVAPIEEIVKPKPIADIPQATDARMFSFSKKIDPPKVASTPIVSLSKSIDIPTSPIVEAPTMSKSIPTLEAQTPATFIEEMPTLTPTDASNLQAIQGIDAETERVLKSAGIDTWEEVSEATPQRLMDILKEGKIRDVDVTHWSTQAILLTDGHFNRLKTFLENLKK